MTQKVQLTSGLDFGMIWAASQLKNKVPVKEQYVSRMRTSSLKEAFETMRDGFMLRLN
jgi:hypothetical protein